MPDKQTQRKQRLKAKRTFIEADLSFPEFLQQLIVKESRHHPSLLKVIRYEPELHFNSIEQKVAHFGYGGYRVYGWTFDDADKGYAEGDKGLGGEVNWIYKDGTSEFQTLLFLHRPTNIKPESTNYNESMLIAVFFHELGHVDDFEKKLHLIPGSAPDLIKAEAYAHHYACKKLMECNLIITMQQYMRELEDQAKSEIRAVRESALSVMRSDEAKVYRQYSDRTEDEIWNEVLRPIAMKRLSPSELATYKRRNRKSQNGSGQ